jgi:hypothetical protein
MKQGKWDERLVSFTVVIRLPYYVPWRVGFIHYIALNQNHLPMSATFYRIQAGVNDFQEQPLYITGNFVLMTAIVSNAYVPDQDNQLWQKIYSNEYNYALVCAHTVNGQQYCFGTEFQLVPFDSSSLDDFACWFDYESNMMKMIQCGQSVINVPGDTYYSGLKLIMFEPLYNAINETWSFVS